VLRGWWHDLNGRAGLHSDACAIRKNQQRLASVIGTNEVADVKRLSFMSRFEGANASGAHLHRGTNIF